MSTGMVALNSDTRAFAAQVAKDHTGFRAAGVPSAGQNGRLPHPLSHLLKELKVVDGTDVNLLGDFLEQVIKIH